MRPILSGLAMLMLSATVRGQSSEPKKNVEPKPLSPEMSLAAMQPRPGFTVELMAAEPLVQDPIAFAFGPDGKLWVVEMGDYPLGVDGKGKPGGRIKFLEKASRERKRPVEDGPYTKSTVFLDNLGYPSGVMPWGKGVIVTCAPDIFYAEDTDGDGKADKKVVLYTGFVEGNQQHRVNGLTGGLDNWVYGANGDSGGTIKSLKSGQTVNISGRDFRIKPDLGLIDAQTGQTQFGRCRDDWGNWFGCNNSNPMFHFVLEDHYLRRNPHLAAPPARIDVSIRPGASRVYPISRTLPRFNNPQSANHFTSACSVTIYRDDLFGPEYANNSFVCEPVHNLIHREIMTPKGVTFTSRRAADEQTSEFLASKDSWFRPTMVQTGPDGALWVADMYRQVIEHPEWIPKDWQKKLDLRAGHDKGRIYRIYPVGKKPRAIPRLDKLNTAGLVAALDSPNGWQRDMAQQMLVRKKDKSAVWLLEYFAQEEKRPQTRLQALCALEGMNAVRLRFLRGLTKDDHPAVRKQVARIGIPLCKPDDDLVKELFNDNDWQVWMQVIYSLGELNDPQVGELLGKSVLIYDPYIFTAAMNSVNKKNIGAMIKEVMKPREQPPPSFVFEKLLIMANALEYREGMATMLSGVATPQDGQYSSRQFAVLAGLLNALDRRNTSLARLQKERPEMKKAFADLVGLYTAARKLVADIQPGKAASLDQTTAIALLGRGLDRHVEDTEALVGLLSPRMADNVQSAAAASLGSLKDRQIAAVLLRGWQGYAPKLRGEVLDILLSRPEWTATTLEAVTTGKVLAVDFDAARRQRLVQHKDSDIRKLASEIFRESSNPDRRKVVASYLKQIRENGDPARGAKVFAKSCAACHQLGGIGQQVGPDLASVPDKSTAALLNAIFDPNQAVEARYVGYVAVTRNGLSLNGLLAAETGTSITLVAADGKKHVILRSDLEELASTGKSAMPEGLEKDVSPAEMTDLLAFIRRSVPAAKRKVPGNQPEVITPAKDGSLLLKASNCEIYGKTLVLEKQYGNLGYWSSPDDHAVWTVDVPKAGRYAVSFDYACDNGTAGNTFILLAGTEKLTGKVAGTGTWDDYKTARVGEISLAAGRQQVILRAAGSIRGAMIDLKMLLLKAVP